MGIGPGPCVGRESARACVPILAVALAVGEHDRALRWDVANLLIDVDAIDGPRLAWRILSVVWGMRIVAPQRPSP